MPVCSDLPMLDTVMVEVPNPKHPKGVKGVGGSAAGACEWARSRQRRSQTALGKRFYSLPNVAAEVLEGDRSEGVMLGNMRPAWLGSAKRHPGVSLNPRISLIRFRKL